MAQIARKAVLMLCHRIPYPADKGDKIRNLHILRALQQVADIHLGCFIDSPFDLQYQNQLTAEVTELFCLYRPPHLGILHATKGILTGQAITSAWFSDYRMQAWVDRIAPATDAVFVSSSAMVQYCNAKPFPVPSMIDLVDVDSDKWRQYAQKSSVFQRWIYQREARLIARQEASAAVLFDNVALVSDNEAACFRQNHPSVPSSKVHGISNGVDTEFYDPARINTPIVAGRIVFTGEMNYKPNVDAVLWFVAEVWPQISQQLPFATFIIVGRNPVPAIQALAQNDNIQVTGRVEDVRPWLGSAALVVAPMQLGRGIKNKVLEAMAMAKPIVATPQAMLGLQRLPETQALVVASTASDFACACLQQIARPSALVPAHRSYVQTVFSWQHTLTPLFSLLFTSTNGRH